MRISNKCSMALHILVLLGVFPEKMPTSAQIAKSVGCNPVMVRNLLGSLKKAALVETRRGIGGSALAKKPEDITIWMVYQAVDAGSFSGFIGLHPNPSSQCPIGKRIYFLLEKPYDKIRDSMRSAMEEITLGQLLDAYNAKQQLNGQLL